MTPLGLSLWKKVLFQFGIALLLLASTQVILIILLSGIGLLPSQLANFSIAQLVSLIIGSASFMALLFTVGPRLINRQPLRASEDYFLGLVVPEQILHECIVLPFGKQYVAVGFITLSSHWQKQIRQILYALKESPFPVTLVVAISVEKEEFIFLKVRCVAESRREVVQAINASCRQLVQKLGEQGVLAEWVQDRLGIEQLYWLCILGKEYDEDVLLQYEENVIVTNVGNTSSRLLVTMDLVGDKVSNIQGIDLNSTLSLLREESASMYLTINLCQVPEKHITHRLHEAVYQAPETGLLIGALGEDLAAQAFTYSLSPRVSELILLLRGRKEGLWQWNLHCICQLTDSPRISESIEWQPKILGCQGFVETATGLFTFTHELPTPSILSFLESKSHLKED